MKNISSVVKKHWPIIIIVILALFLRLFKISSYMTFLGDEGRDALVWLRMAHGKLTLIGPQTSIGNMYLGPLFYYFMFPFYVILGTTGPSIGVALFAGATTFLLWKIGKELFSERVGLLAAFFYAISPVAITLSRSSWNPNVMPFFSLLIIWGVWQFWQKENFKWIAIIGILLSFAIQSHYLGILLIPVVGLFWLIKLMELIKKKDKNIKIFIFPSVLCALFFVLLSVVPLVWFDLRHNFINYKAFYKFFTDGQTPVGQKPYKAVIEMWPLWNTLVKSLVLAKNEVLGFWFSIMAGISLLISFVYLYIKGKVNKNQSFVLIIVWLLVGLLGMGFYKEQVHDHYFGFLFPDVFILSALFLETVWKYKKVGKVVASLLFIVVVYFNLNKNPLLFPSNNQIDHTLKVAEAIVKYSNNTPFNLAMIAKQNYDASYRYFLEKWGRKAIEIDAQKYDVTLTNQLFVVCEEKDCQPIGHAQAEIANFGWAKIENMWEFPWGTKLFKLIQNK